MPYFLHQWCYHDEQVREIIAEKQNRELIVRDIAEALDGEVLYFFFCMGEYDGMALSRFPDGEKALACLMLIVGEGSVRRLRTTPLIESAEILRAIDLANSIAHPP